ncbi:MAG: hypothetical protein ACKVKH_05650 [Verrucomicrobiales bacterium]
MSTFKKSIQIAVIGSALAALTSLTSCCGSSQEIAPPISAEPAK